MSHLHLCFSVFSFCMSNLNTYSCCLLLAILYHNDFYAGIINLLLFCCIVLVVHPSDDLIHSDQHVIHWCHCSWCFCSVFGVVLMWFVAFFIGCCIFCLLFCCIVLVVHLFCNVIGWDHLVICLHHYFCCFCFMILLHHCFGVFILCVKFKHLLLFVA